MSGSCLGIGLLLFLKLSMMLEDYLVWCLTKSDFLKIIVLPQKWVKWAKNVFFEFIGKFSHYFFLNLVCRKFILFAVFLYKSHTWEKSGSWDMRQNVISQSDCRIFKSTIRVASRRNLGTLVSAGDHGGSAPLTQWIQDYRIKTLTLA